eukprot:scaffold4695_cov70-Cylindrotheca_fusiformis.AAC.1
MVNKSRKTQNNANPVDEQQQPPPPGDKDTFVKRWLQHENNPLDASATMMEWNHNWVRQMPSPTSTIMDEMTLFHTKNKDMQSCSTPYRICRRKLTENHVRRTLRISREGFDARCSKIKDVIVQ